MTRDDFKEMVEEHVTKDNYEMADVMAEYDRLTAELAALKEATRWISVAERLPEDDDVVWGAGRTVSGNIYVDEVYVNCFQWYLNRPYSPRTRVTHWQEIKAPLPPEAA